MGAPQVYLESAAPHCLCGGNLVVDTAERDGDVVSYRFKCFPYEANDAAVVTRCYCSKCGLMYHPATVFKEASL